MDMYLAHGAGDDGIGTVLVLLAVAPLILGLVIMLARSRLGPSPVEEPEEPQDIQDTGARSGTDQRATRSAT